MASEADLDEQLKNMSPEQIRQLQKQQCIFCRIAEGKIQARKVYEDESFIAVLDINPGTPGHMLVMPKEHYSILPQLPDETIAHLGALAKHLSQAALRALKAQGTTVFAANGLAAGQRAAHFLLHIIPRMEGDGAGIIPPFGQLSEENLQKLQAQLQPFIDRAFGKESTEPAPPLSPAEVPLISGKPEPATKTAGGEKGRDGAEKDARGTQSKGKAPAGDKSNLDAITDFLAGGT